MAFHVACPITCRKICFCALGFPRKLRTEDAKNDFLREVDRVERFLNDPWLIKERENATIQVKVPKVVASPALLLPPTANHPPPDVAGGSRDEGASARAKMAALQKQAAAASLAAEDYARKFESGDLMTSVKGAAGEDRVQSNTKVMCRLCFSGEYEGSEKEIKMLSCITCGKKYHRSCIKAWSQNRDLFHWSSWTCPCCRTCEVCRKTGDQNKFMFCKRCDGAYHCYCQQPPHKNVGHGPYLCPKHTKCHSCGSSVPGNGLSVRWFLGYTCCDACGRLFVKGNYCPVCLKVYRDSESTPMVCCDICQRWVHCPCDGISDAKYMQFQVDRNLQYACPTCRGECCQVKSLEESVQELWRKRDEADKDLIASLREAAGLPVQEELFDIPTFSDDEENVPVVKNEFSRSLKFSLKGLTDKSPKKNKENRKKSSKDEEMDVSAFALSPIAGSLGVSPGSGRAFSKHKSIDEVSAASNTTKASRTIKIKSNKSRDLTNREEAGSSGAAKGPKLVIHLGGRSKTVNSPPRSDSKRGQESASIRGYTSHYADQSKGPKLIKLKNPNSEFPKNSSRIAFSDGYESISPKKTNSVLGKRSAAEDNNAFIRSESEVPVSKRHKYSSTIKQVDDVPSSIDQKPSLKFKIPKNSSSGNQGDITYTRGQRSKRKAGDEDGGSQQRVDSTVKDFTDANWILQKLGKDAVGKRVEIHESSSNSWHRGTVVETFEGTSFVSIAIDDGKTKRFELGKQGVRFVSQKQKH